MSHNNSFDRDAVLNADKNHVWHHLSQHKPYESSDPMIIVEGNGMRVRDIEGREYLDGTSGGVWTVNVGYGRERIAKVLYDQSLRMNYFAGSHGTIPGAKFAAALIDKMPSMSRVYYSNTGSEANEKCFKIVRQLSARNHASKKYKILYRERDYHGTTISTLSASGQGERKSEYEPFTPGFVQVPHCCEYRSQWGEVDDYGLRAANAIEQVILQEGPDTVGALCLETITAGGGVIVPPEGYWERVQEICKQYDVLLHLDEVVCGVGRTGKWFGYQHYDVKPDLVTMAKGVASGYAAIACTVTTEAVFEQFKKEPEDVMSYFRDISTFGGCAAGAAAALENMHIIEDEKLLENVTLMGDYLQGCLLEMKPRYPIIGDVRGKGLFQGVELVADRASKTPLHERELVEIVAHCMREGVLIGRTNRSLPGFNNTLTFSPALICTKDDIDQIIAALDRALEAAQARQP